MKPVSILFLSIAALASPSWADDSPESKADAWLRNFARLDLDHSCGLSKAELEKSKPAQLGDIKAKFAGMDLDKDGQVTLSEYGAHFRKPTEARLKTFKVLDLNGDGMLSKAELDKAKPAQAANLGKRFDDLDADRDHQVSLGDWGGRKAALLARLDAMEDRQAGFRLADTDQSGSLSRAEVETSCATLFAGLKRDFDQADVDRGKLLSPAEFNAYLDKARPPKPAATKSR